MSRLSEEMRLIPRIGWWIAALVYVGFGIFLFLVLQKDADTRAWPSWGQALFSVFVPVPLAVYALLVAYINSDSRRRGMRYVLWTLLAIFIPNGIGIILYFVLRDPLLVRCSSCGASLKPGFAFCPACGAGIGKACPDCRRLVEPEWTNCAYCGRKL